MEGDDPPRRSTRRVAKNRFRVPSSAHYVGYVEDNETPEMIMKKFEELDKVITDTKPGQAGDGALETDKCSKEEVGEEEEKKEEGCSGFLNEEQLNELFKRTSMFTVKSAMARERELLQREMYGGGGEEEDWMLSEEEEEMFSEEEGEEVFWEEEGEVGNKKRVSRRGEGRQKQRVSYQVLTQTGTGTLLRIRRKASTMHQDDIFKMAIPTPLPLSWGRTIKPLGIPKRLVQSGTKALEGAMEPPADYVQFPDLTGANLSKYYRRFIGVLINPGWEGTGIKPGGVSRLAKIPIPSLNPHGFIFIWLKKTQIQQVWSLMTKWRYVYVENLTWVMLKPNNQIMMGDSEVTRISHLTLYIFRKEGEGKDIEMRHQRSPDVVVNCKQRSSLFQEWKAPDEVYISLETMLPSAGGKFLELWSSREASRPGWVHVAEVEE